MMRRSLHSIYIDSLTKNRKKDEMRQGKVRYIARDIMKRKFCLHTRLETHPYVKTGKKRIIAKREKERDRANGKQRN